MFTNSQVRYLTRESLSVFRRMKGMSLVSTLIMSVALLMLALFTLVTLNMRGVARSFRSEIEVDVFLKDGHSVEEVQALRQRVAPLEQEKHDLEVMLEMATDHADDLSETLQQERDDLETMLEMTTDHADAIEAENRYLFGGIETSDLLLQYVTHGGLRPGTRPRQNRRGNELPSQRRPIRRSDDSRRENRKNGRAAVRPG